MINVGAKVWGKRSFFGDSMPLFLMCRAQTKKSDIRKNNPYFP